MMDPWKLENIRKSFEAGSPLAQGAALHKLQEMANEIAKLREENERLREALHELDEYLRYNTVVSEETEPERIFSKAFGSKASLAKEPTP